MVGLRLFLPEVWTDDPDLMARALIPKDLQINLVVLQQSRAGQPEQQENPINRTLTSTRKQGQLL